MAKAQECIPRRDLAIGASKITGRPRTNSVEPMESVLSTSQGKPAEVHDIDSEEIEKEYACAEYAMEISLYLKQREVIFI